MHLKEGEDSESFVKDWPDTAFWGKTHIHRIQSKSEKSNFIAYAKNIPTHISEEAVKVADSIFFSENSVLENFLILKQCIIQLYNFRKK